MNELKFRLNNLGDLASAIIRFAIFVPLYKVVVACERRNIHLPFRVIHAANRGDQRSRSDLSEITRYYFC